MELYCHVWAHGLLRSRQARGQVSHLAKIKFNRVPGCEEVCEWEVKWEMGNGKWEMGDLTLYF